MKDRIEDCKTENITKRRSQRKAEYSNQINRIQKTKGIPQRTKDGGHETEDKEQIKEQAMENR